METNNHIDQILQKGLEHFEPTPPADAWDFIEQHVQATPPSSSVGSSSKLVQSIKGLSIGAKVAAILSVPALLGAIYFAVPSSNKTLDNSVQVNSTTQEVVPDEIPAPSVGSDLVLNQSTPEIKKLSATSEIKGAEPKGQNVNQAETPRELIPVSSTPTTATVVSPKPILPEPSKSNKEETKTSQEVQIIKHPKVDKADNANQVSSFIEPEFGNAFSPDGDGKNDTWEIRLENATYFHLKIMDSRGQLVFETDQLDHFWNGANFKSGVDCDGGQYVFILDYQAGKMESAKTKGGFINLVR